MSQALCLRVPDVIIFFFNAMSDRLYNPRGKTRMEQ